MGKLHLRSCVQVSRPRCRYRRRLRSPALPVAILRWTAHYARTPRFARPYASGTCFCHRRTDCVGNSVPPAPGCRLDDLFHLEQKLGRWHSEGHTEWDIVQDTFTPFNCRALVDSLKGVDEEYQKAPEFETGLLAHPDALARGSLTASQSP